MLDSIRKRQRVLMIIITAIAIISFAWVFNPSSKMGGGGMPPVGEINGRSITVDELQKAATGLQLATAVGLNEYPQLLALNGGAGREQALQDAAWNLLVLREEIKRLQIEPTNGQVAKAEKALAFFQTNGQFDAAKYQNLVDNLLKNQQMTAVDLDQIVADDLRVKAILAVLKPTYIFPVSAFQKDFTRYSSKIHLSVIQFKRADFETAVHLSDQEIQKEFNEHKANYQMPEKRKVALIRLTLTDAQKKLPDDQKEKAMKPLASKADAFSQLEHPEGFDALAQKEGVKVETTGFFTQSALDPLFGGNDQLAQQSFALTKESPVSTPIQVDDGFAIMKLVEVQPARPMTFDEARSGIVTSLKERQVSAAMTKKAEDVQKNLVAAMANGTSFADAAQKAGCKVELPPPFSIRDAEQNNLYARIIYTSSISLKPGLTSQPLQSLDGTVILHINSVDAPEVKATEAALKEQYPKMSEYFGNDAFKEWLRAAGKKIGQLTAPSS
jgi:peptidyl-prolyl cis-trans isomerase D